MTMSQVMDTDDWHICFICCPIQLSHDACLGNGSSPPNVDLPRDFLDFFKSAISVARFDGILIFRVDEEVFVVSTQYLYPLIFLWQFYL